VEIPNDDELVKRAQEGDLDAFNKLVERYQVQMYNLALRYINDAFLAEDVTQEAFVAAWRAIGSFRGGSFRSWLFRILINEAHDLRRRHIKRTPGSLDQMLEELGEFPQMGDPHMGPEETAVSAATFRAIEQYIQKLPEEYKLVLLLVDVQGLAYDEAASVLRLPLGTVKSRLFRGRCMLREFLKGSGEL